MNKTAVKDKRKSLKELIAAEKTFTMIGAFDAICAKFVEKNDIPCTYVSGSTTSASAFGLPDLGLVSMKNMAFEAGNIAKTVNIPTIADADTGFGEAKSIPDAIKVFEDSGVSGIHIEDQVYPKRCGHLAGKEVIPEKEMVEKIKYAINARVDQNFVIIARVDSYSVNGFEDMLHRAQAYADAGADMIFPEALTSLSEFEQTVKAVKKPILANMTEFGKTPYTTVSQFSEIGIRAVLFPLSVYRTTMKTMEKAIQSIKEHGNQERLVPQMMTRKDFYDFIDYESYEKELP